MTLKLGVVLDHVFERSWAGISTCKSRIQSDLCANSLDQQRSNAQSNETRILDTTDEYPKGRNGRLVLNTFGQCPKDSKII